MARGVAVRRELPERLSLEHLGGTRAFGGLGGPTRAASDVWPLGSWCHTSAQGVRGVRTELRAVCIIDSQCGTYRHGAESPRPIPFTISNWTQSHTGRLPEHLEPTADGSEACELALANRKLARSGWAPLSEKRLGEGVPTLAETVERVPEQKRGGPARPLVRAEPVAEHGTLVLCHD